EGGLELTDPVSTFIPSFADVRVYTGGSDLRPGTQPGTEPGRRWHPLTDTAFYADGDATRLAALYRPGPDGTAVRLDALDAAARERPAMLSGGGGLVSTAADYHRFTQMLLRCADSPAGELDGTRLLSPRTVSYMSRNHIPGGLDLEAFGRPLYAESPFRG